MDIRLYENLQNKKLNYLAPFLWLHWEDDALILKEIEKIYESGIRSVCLESRTHEDFMHSGWWEDLDIIFAECEKRGMKVWILDDKHFPSGYANGVYENKKELQPWGITEKHISLSGPIKDGCVIADGWLEAPEDELVAVIALEKMPNCEKYYNNLIDLTPNLKDGMVYMDLPEGLWQITFIIKTRSGMLPHCLHYGDKLNPDAIEYYINEVYRPHFERYSRYFGNVFLGFFSDESCFGNNNFNGWCIPEFGQCFVHHPWNNRVMQKLTEIYEKEAPKYLAGLWFDIDGISESIRYNFMNIVTDEYRKNYTNPLADWCNEHGVMYIGHIIEDNNFHAATGPGPGHYFRALDRMDMAGVDVVLHQIMPGLTECRSSGPVFYKHMNCDFYNYSLAKLASSFAHIDAKKKGRAMCEIFGAYGWAEGTRLMKYLMDHMLVRGINYYVPHAFSPKPNDTDCPPNFYDSGRNPQFKYFGDSMNYLNRMCHILSGGRHISSCAILYDAENIWLAGENVPLEKIGKKLFDNLLDYDIIPADYLEKLYKDNCINGEKYNVLLVPYSSSMSEAVLNKLKNISVPVILVTDGSCENTYGFKTVDINETVEYMKIFRDISSDYKGIYLRAFHILRDGRHICMLSNEDIHNTISAKMDFSFYDGSSYIEYNAFENKAVKKHGTVNIHLAPYNSTVLIFEKDCGKTEEYKVKEITETISLNKKWKISLARENSSEFAFFDETSRLINITGPEGVRDFSGQIKYETAFEDNKGEGSIIDFGYVGEAMELFVNNNFVGKKQFPPYKFDVSDYVVDGTNSIIAVVSNHNGYKRRDYFSKFMLMEASGITGPVVLNKYRKPEISF